MNNHYQAGATIVEYALILALVVVVMIVSVNAFDSANRARISRINESAPFDHSTKPLLVT